jgi:hypothetical protein
MDQGVLAAETRHNQAKESVKRGKAAEKAFLAQRDVVQAEAALQLCKQQLQMSHKSSNGTSIIVERVVTEIALCVSRCCSATHCWRLEAPRTKFANNSNSL